MKRLLQILLLAIPGTNMYPVCAQNSKTINVVTTAVPFLRISPDAGAAGMGSTGIATTPGISAVYYNIGKIPFASSPFALTVNYSPWLKDWANDMYLASLAGYYHLDNLQAIHGGLTYFSPGSIQLTDDNGSYLQSYHPKEFGINVGYSRKLSEKTGIGLGMKYIYSNLAGKGAGDNYKAGNAIAADLGFYYNGKKENGDGWSFGTAITNLGSKISYSRDASQKNFIPANLGLGAGYGKVFNDQHTINIGLDINKLLVPTPPVNGDAAALTAYRNKTVMESWFTSFSDASGGFSEELKEIQLSVGAEYWYNKQFAIRAGYFYEDKTKANREYFSAGTGIKYNIVTLNFAYLAPLGRGTNKNPLSNSLLFGLIFNIKE